MYVMYCIGVAIPVTASAKVQYVVVAHLDQRLSVWGPWYILYLFHMPQYGIVYFSVGEYGCETFAIW